IDMRECARHAEGCGARAFSRETAGMVPAVSAGFALAARQRSLPSVVVRDHAAADARGCGDSLLRKIFAAVSGCAGSGGSAAGRSAEVVVRTGVLQPGA